MNQSNFTNLSGGINNLIKLLPNGFTSQSSSLLDQSATPMTHLDPSATPATPTTHVDNSFSIAQFVALTASTITVIGCGVYGAYLLFNRMNSRRANRDNRNDNNIEAATVLGQSQQRGQVEMSILSPALLDEGVLRGVVIARADLDSGTNVNNQMPLPQFPFSPITDANPSISPSPLPPSPSPPSQLQSRG